MVREHGPAFLDWVRDTSFVEHRSRLIASALSELLPHIVQSPADAQFVWRTVPAVLSQCNEQVTYSKPMAAAAYAWLHLLDRYGRSWCALETLVRNNSLPIARNGIKVLDVGTGPGPAALATVDFYRALTAFADSKDIGLLRQPINVDCVEVDSSTNHLRHNLAEIIASSEQREPPDAVLSLCGGTFDFGQFLPRQDRKNLFTSLRSEEDVYWNEVQGCWDSDRVYTAEEADRIAQSRYRYRLIVISNFLTTLGTFIQFRPNLVDVLHDARPRTVLLLIGGKAAGYPAIYRHVDRLAYEAGFLRTIVDQRVTNGDSVLAEIAYNFGRRFYEYLQGLSPNSEACLDIVHKHYSRERGASPISNIRAYRKPGQWFHIS